MVTALPTHGGRIRKVASERVVAPNLTDYEQARARFTWEQAREALDGLPGGRGLNIAHEAVDRHAAGALRDTVALRWLGRAGDTVDISYGDLRASTNRFAHVLRALGLSRGDRVFALTGRIPELYVAALGTLKAGCVFSPLFSAFGPEPVRERLAIGSGRVLVTTPALFRTKVAPVFARLPELEYVLLVGEPEAIGAIPGAYDLRALLAEQSPELELAPTDPQEPALLHFTSGTTGARRARCTCTRRSWPITPPAPSRSTCTRATCSGARPTRAGSRARPTGSSRR